MKEQDFKTDIQDFNINQEGSVSAQSPSNIALIKYWGKTEPQIPTNPSISYTLSKSYTSSTLEFSPKKTKENYIRVIFEGNENEAFVPKIRKFFDRIQYYAPYLSYFDFTLRTENSFPHSSGIASSASGMNALAKCLVKMEENLGFSVDNPQQRISFLSRLGSGSACRSNYNGLVVWGENEFVEKSSSLYAVLLESKIHEIFKSFNDTILLIHEGKKTVSSTVGHQLMNHHPYAEKRFQEANHNLGKLISILKNGDLDAFGKLVEHEALSLHAMMMTSNPAFILMKPNTVAAIEKIWEYRQQTKQPLFFTLDAGANIHLLYPTSSEKEILNFIQQELMIYCEKGHAIFDSIHFD